MAGTAPDFSTDVNPYEVLGLGLGSPQLSAADIKSAYRKKALLLHPDKRKQTERAGTPTVLASTLCCVASPRCCFSHATPPSASC
jgi:DnaJ domain